MMETICYELSFTRDLLTRKTTHLIANPQQTHKQLYGDGRKTINIERSGGEKIREALKHRSRIEILTPLWLETCRVERARVPERDYRIFPHSDGIHNSSGVEIGEYDLEEVCDRLLVPGKVPLNPLFSTCFFFLVGFSDNDDCNDDNNRYESNAMASKQKFLRLVRRCMGTVLWDLNERITHVVVNDRCDPKVKSGVYKFCRRHSNCPTPVSPQWIIASLNNQHLVQVSLYPPTVLVTGTSSNTTLATVPATTRQQRRRQPKLCVSSSLVPIRSQSVGMVIENAQLEKEIDAKSGVDGGGLFEGVIFHIVSQTPMTPPLPNTPCTVSFDADEVEEAIVSQGGKKLCQRVIDKLLQCRSSIDDKNLLSSKMGRICYVVKLFGGVYDINSLSTKDKLCSPSSLLLSKIQDICKIVYVTHIWVQTCLALKMITPPEEFPSLFQPHLWPLQKLSIKIGKTGSNSGNVGIKVAVTGFQGAERVGISRLLIAMGASYTETMGNRNTHLICKEAVGPKFNKAVEWGLYVVTVEWLFHIAKFGYNGCDGSDDVKKLLVEHKSLSVQKGCERKFSPGVVVVGKG